jgi:hypothetical protein
VSHRFDVMQNGRVISANLDRHDAEMKVENERRGGWHMTIREHVPQLPYDPSCEEEDD